MRVVPQGSKPTTFTGTTTSAPSAPGIHDTLRHGVGASAYDVASGTPASTHPLEARLRNWEATQDAVRMNSLRRTFGMGEPIRRAMELKMVRESEWRPIELRAAAGDALPSVHEDILRGRDETITWDDVFTGETAVRQVPGVHEEMERKLKI